MSGIVTADGPGAAGRDNDAPLPADGSDRTRPTDEAPAPAWPADPAGFRLAGAPPRVMRLSRKAMAAIGVGVAVAIAGSLIYALQPSAPRPAPNLYETDATARPEAIARAPADYTDVPKLGPPLPGDLGGPIVAAQQEGAFVPVPAMTDEPTSRAPQPSPSADAARQERERIAGERDSARISRLFLGSQSAAANEVQSPAQLPQQSAATTVQAAATSMMAPQPGFLDAQGRRPPTAGARLTDPASPYVVQAGSVIPAALMTAIHSDLPGQITAQVTQNVYDSPTGRVLLIPQGARLIGQYDSEVVAGQNRVLLAWDRLILPGGRSIELDRQPGADASGRAGLADRTDHHWGQLLRAALVSTLLGVGAEIATDDSIALVRALQRGTQDSIGQTGRRIVERQLGRPPTLTIRAGFAMRVIVTRDLVLEPIGSGL